MSAPAAGAALQPLLDTLEDPAAPPSELTDAHLAIVSRLTGEECKEFAEDVRRHFPQLCRVFKAHVSSQNAEVNNAALQALGFCVFNSSIAAELPATEVQLLLSAVNSVAAKTSDKNTRTRALWVISKQTFPSEIVKKEVSSIISTLEAILAKGDAQSVVVEYEALNVIIRLMEQTPAQMGEEAVRWAKLVIPLVVHSAQKLQLRGAAALEMGMPLLLQKQQEVAALTKHLITTEFISELKKLFSTKNETYVLKLWPLFVKLLGKVLHRSGSFINSWLQLEEFGFRSGAPVVKKMAFIAWKSLIDNFALNPDILCSAKRLKLLMQPLNSIHVRTESLALTKLEVWWYLLMRLGPRLPANFEQVCVPLIQSTLSVDSAALQGTSPRLPANQSSASANPAQKAGPYPSASLVTTRMNSNSSTAEMVVTPSIQLLGIEMLLHFLMGPGVVEFAKQNKLVLGLEPLQYPLISSPSFFCKHASTLTTAVQDGFIAIGKEVPDCTLNIIWKEINGFVKTATESGSKKEKQGSEILTVLLQTLKNIVRSNSLPVQKTLPLIDITIKELPPKVLGSPAYQVADMDLLNFSFAFGGFFCLGYKSQGLMRVGEVLTGICADCVPLRRWAAHSVKAAVTMGTPALFLIQLPFHDNLLERCVTDERFFVILETLVGYVLSGPTSPLAFSESVICVINQHAKQVENKEHLWRMWSIVVNPLTDWINRTNEVNQGDALEHNFSAVYSALLLPVSHIFPAQEFPQPTMKSLLRTWSDLYRAFARCAALVATAEENLCCEELCAKIISGLESETSIMFSMMDGLTHIISVMVDCINFAPYGTKYQPKTRSPQTPTDWSKKKEPLGKLASLFKLLVMLLSSFHVFSSQETCSETLISVGPSVIAVLHNIIGHISLPSVIGSMFAMLSKPLAVFYERAKLPDGSPVYGHLNSKLEKLLAEIIVCLQSHCTGSYDSELLEQLSPLLCVVFQHRSNQLRNQGAHFWNATFAKATSLTYPEELKSVLSQAKKKIPLLLPGFESIEIAEDYSGPFSDVLENSQLDAKISGMEVKRGQKRDSILAQTSELKSDVKDKSNSVQVPPAKLKLEFPSLKTRSEILLEEEKSADFVFIPPESKARVLTEHQKEVLRSKRVGIPTMYSTLDTSQDSTLFSQYTESQEDSLEKSTLIESAKEDAKTKPQEEKAKSEGCTEKLDEITEKCIPDDPLENAACVREPSVTHAEESSTSKSEGESEQDPAKTIPEEPSAGEGLEKSTEETAPKEPLVETGNVSNVSSSSASSDVISGTPQPTSRRQSFITLEKFSSSENRPFSLSALSSSSEVPGSTSEAGKEESTSVCKTSAKPEKSGEESKKPSKSESEQIITTIRRLTRRQSKMEHTQPKVPKLEQDSLVSSSMENSPGLPSAVEDMEPVLAQSQALHSTDADVKKAEGTIADVEKGQALDMDSKENTPPEMTVSSEQVAGSDGQVPHVSPGQKTVRRSLRRRSEAAESTTGGQDTEDGHQKRDRHKDDDKSGQKKVLQAKDDAFQKQKVVSGKITENSAKKESSVPERTAAEDLSSRESPPSRGLDAEANRSARRPEDNLKADSEGQDCSSGAAGQKKVEHPRYHTRRSSQGLLSSIENSEADGSEAKEESTRKRKSPRLKNRNDSLEGKLKDLQPGSYSHEVSSQGTEMKSLETGQSQLGLKLSTDATLTSETGDPKTQAVPTDGGKAVASASSGGAPDAESASVDQSPEVSDEALKAAEDDKQAEKQPSVDCSAALPECAPGASRGDGFPSQVAECQQKRSKRVKKLKNCDSCCNKSKRHVMSSTKSKTERAPEVTEPQTPPVCTPVNTSEVFGKSHLDESLSLAPCAMSTPLHPQEPSAFSLEGERTFGDDLPGNSVAIKEVLEHPEGIVGEATCSAADRKEPADESGRTDQCLSRCVSHETGDSSVAAGDWSEESAAPEKRVHQNGQLEETPETQSAVTKPEENQVNEPESDGDHKEAADSTAADAFDVPEMKEELVETEITVPESMAIDQEDAVENPSVDSPQKAEDHAASVTDSPTGVQARCTWSPSASPSMSILKRGVKRNQEDDALSPSNKIRRVSFADPLYQEGLADDIDRRSPVIRPHSASPSSRSLKILANQAKHITTPTKGFLSPGSRNPKLKSSKKCLITEIAKELLSSHTDSVYPALADCKAPVSVLLPRITSNICARGLWQLIRAKNIRTVGDLSILTASEIKTLPIRSPKFFNLRKALKGYHEQQVKSRGLEGTAALEDAEKPISDLEDKSLSVDEEKLATDLLEPLVLSTTELPQPDLLSQLDTLVAQVSAEGLQSYSVSQLFEMQEKVMAMVDCIMKNLQSRWKSPPRESSD